MRLTSKRALPTIALIILLLGGAAIRISIASHAVPFGDDYGTAALMSKHIVEGHRFPLYFYGYRYIGALGAYVGAVMFALFGQSLFSLCLAMVPFSLLWIFATFLLFRRLIGAWPGVLAAAVVAFPPPLLVVYSTVPLLGYVPSFAFGTLLLYLGVRLNDRDLSGGAEWLCLLTMAACAGLALWTDPISIPYLLVAFGLLVAHVIRARFRPALLVKLGVAFVLLVAALLPVIVTALDYGLGAMFGHWPVGLRFIPRSFSVMVDQYLPDQLFRGGFVPPAVGWVVRALYGVLGLGLAAGLAVAALKRDRRILRAACVPLAFVATFVLLFLMNSKTAGGLCRYFTPFYLGLVTCIVFPLAYRRAWLSAAAVLIAAMLLAYNLGHALTIALGTGTRVIAEKNAGIGELVRAAEANGLRHVMIESYYGQAMTFVSGERVIFVRTMKERYYPHTVSAAADDHAGFAKMAANADVFAQTLEALGISSWASFTAGGWTVFHDIELPRDRLRLVEPVAASFTAADGTSVDAEDLIDGHEETVGANRLDSGRALVVDFGRPVELTAARFTAPNRRDCPVGYTFSASLDGTTWHEIQRVEDRAALTCIYGNRLDHEGPFTAMECRFPATRLRYLRLSDVRLAALFSEVWQFREACFYARAEATGDEAGGRPNDAEARTIARELDRRGVGLLIADEWLSRKIDLLAEPHPRVWPRWEFRFPKTRHPRIVPIERGTAVVVESAHADDVAERLEPGTLGDVAFDRVRFAHYTAFVIEKAPDDCAAFPGLRWNGFTLVDTARVATADWHHRYGERLERAGQLDAAKQYYWRAFDLFPGIEANVRRLAQEDERARRRLAALTPARKAPCTFPHGVSLVGYTLTPSPLVAGQPATLRLVWQLEGRVKHNFMQVFVHLRDRTRRWCQVDHNAVFPVQPGAVVPPALVLDEYEFLVPHDAPSGTPAIYLGATSVADRSVRLKPRTKLPTWHCAVEIGRVQVRTGAGAN